MGKEHVFVGFRMCCRAGWSISFGRKIISLHASERNCKKNISLSAKESIFGSFRENFVEQYWKLWSHQTRRENTYRHFDTYFHIMWQFFKRCFVDVSLYFSLLPWRRVYAKNSMFFRSILCLFFAKHEVRRWSKGTLDDPYTIRSKDMKKIACTQFNEESAYFQQNNRITIMLNIYLYRSNIDQFYLYKLKIFYENIILHIIFKEFSLFDTEKSA